MYFFWETEEGQLFQLKGQLKNKAKIYQLLQKKKDKLALLISNLPVSLGSRIDNLYKIMQNMMLDGYRLIPQSALDPYFMPGEDPIELLAVLEEYGFLKSFTFDEVVFTESNPKDISTFHLSKTERKYFALLMPQIDVSQLAVAILSTSIKNAIDKASSRIFNLNMPLMTKEKFFQLGIDPIVLQKTFKSLSEEKGLVWIEFHYSLFSTSPTDYDTGVIKSVPFYSIHARRNIRKLLPVILQAFIKLPDLFTTHIHPTAYTVLMVNDLQEGLKYFTEKDGMAVAQIILKNPGLFTKEQLVAADRINALFQYIPTQEISLQEKARLARTENIWREWTEHKIAGFLDNLEDFIEEKELLNFLQKNKGFPEYQLRTALKFLPDRIQKTEFSYAGGVYFYYVSLNTLLSIYNKNHCCRNSHEKFATLLTLKTIKETIQQYERHKVSKCSINNAFNMEIYDLKMVLSQIDKDIPMTYHELEEVLPRISIPSPPKPNRLSSIKSLTNKISNRIKLKSKSEGKRIDTVVE